MVKQKAQDSHGFVIVATVVAAAFEQVQETSVQENGLGDFGILGLGKGQVADTF